MKAAYLTGPSRFEIREIPDPELSQDTDVFLKMELTGICGSDLHFFRNSRVGDKDIQYPFLIGHECVAIVEKTGKAVASVQPGYRVAVEPAVSCGNCDQCRDGRAHTCRNLGFLGSPDQLPGCLSEYLVMPEACCYPVPEVLTAEEAVFIEPVSIGLYCWELVRNVNSRKIGILGVGPIGLSVLLAARSRGATHIYATDKVPARLHTAKKMGAGWIANPDEIDVVEAAPHELDVVFECCGQTDAIVQAIYLLKPGGHLVIAGIPEEDNVTLPIHELRRREITIHNVRRQNEQMQPAIDLVLREQAQIRPLITHSYGLDDAQAAFENTADYTDGVVKAVIRGI